MSQRRRRRRRRTRISQARTRRRKLLFAFAFWVAMGWLSAAILVMLIYVLLALVYPQAVHHDHSHFLLQDLERE